MEDSRSLEGQEEPEARGERSDAAVELESATFEPEARVERSGGYAEAEAIETVFVQVVETAASEEALPEIESVREVSAANDTSDSPLDRGTSSAEEGLDDTEENRRQPEESEDGERELQLVMLQAELSRKHNLVTTLSSVIKKADSTDQSVIRNLK